MNHGVEEELSDKILEESKKFFSLPWEEKRKLAHKENRGFTPLYGELLDTDSDAKGLIRPPSARV